eukprot:TRINITY_DN67517_c2_g11_i2.p2 TRINITY_DN67517_c2_g11~~TRINITY_DN67517_c2_g11_i2.p2  ORF type:complete len:101 (-),score=13.83 TRINITY_DN67517_c2_g11_i2:256-528(-)
MGDNHEARLAAECVQLIKDINRLGSKNADGKASVKFGVLFDDEQGQQFYEAIVGTLKAAKKRGMVEFKGQMLLKGAHDDVDIIALVEPEA